MYSFDLKAHMGKIFTRYEMAQNRKYRHARDCIYVYLRIYTYISLSKKTDFFTRHVIEESIL